jgi:hypothetical protein
MKRPPTKKKQEVEEIKEEIIAVSSIIKNMVRVTKTTY